MIEDIIAPIMTSLQWNDLFCGEAICFQELVKAYKNNKENTKAV